MRQRVVYFAMILAAVTSVSAQEAKKWTLDDCIDYALEKNIQLQQDKISLEESFCTCISMRLENAPDLTMRIMGRSSQCCSNLCQIR